jgi:PAS domain S-box-containing protein
MVLQTHPEPLRILVVEDEDAHAELICRAFETPETRGKYSVCVARHLKEARDYLQRSVPDLVIADLLLPDGKGTELVWDEGRDYRIPLIVMTSGGDEVAAVEALKGGALDYVVKSGSVFLDMPRIADRALREWDHITQRRKAEEKLRIHQVQLEMQNEELRRTQTELENSRDKYSELYDFAPVGYVTLDRQGVVLEANFTAATLLNSERQNLIGQPFPRFVSADDAAAYHLYLRRVLQTRTKHSHELRLVKRHGEPFHARLESVAVQDADGHFTRCRTILVDVTDRKRAEEGLRESEQRFKAIFNSDHVVMLIIDPENGKIEDGSPGACAFYGYSRGDLMKRKISEINALPADVVFGHMQTVKSRQCAYFDFRHRLASGEIRDVEVCSGPIVVGGRTLLFSVINDITDRKLAEAAVRESEERFRAVFESAEDCIVIKDRSLRYAHVNSALSKLIGLPKSQIVGKMAADLYGEETGQRLTELETRVLAGDSIEVEQSRPVQGVSLTFHDTLVPLRNAVGQIIGLCCISRNITERKKLVLGKGIRRMRYPSPAMRSTLEKALIAAERDSIVLLHGESGTGKDYLARWLHDRSKRASGPFFAINCAALPRELAESELFGHERGAFTGATSLKKGLLELAEAGTILLNEIGELELPLQSKLLTFLDTRSFMRVGGQRPLQVNARLIAATHRELEIEVDEGRFLEPLYYRLTVFPLRVPPLRERAEDIPILAEELTSKLAEDMQLAEAPRLRPDHFRTLSRYHWPGNVRELRNVLERSLILWAGGEFQLAFPQAGRREGDWSYTVRYLPGKSLREVTDGVAVSLCAEVLKRCSDNKKETARILDISRDTLYRYIRKIKT